MLDTRARSGTERVIAPIARALVRIGISATTITLIGGAVAVTGGALIGAGWLAAGAVVATAGALLDLVDGPIARLSGTVSTRGAFVDTVTDRLGEIALWAGTVAAVRLDPLLVTLAAVGFGGSILIPFIRSKAEGWGIEAARGWFGRAERMIVGLAGVGLHGFGLSDLVGVNVLAVALWILAVGVWITALQRAWATWQGLDGA